MNPRKVKLVAGDLRAAQMSFGRYLGNCEGSKKGDGLVSKDMCQVTLLEKGNALLKKNKQKKKKKKKKKKKRPTSNRKVALRQPPRCPTKSRVASVIPAPKRRKLPAIGVIRSPSSALLPFPFLALFWRRVPLLKWTTETRVPVF